MKTVIDSELEMAKLCDQIEKAEGFVLIEDPTLSDKATAVRAKSIELMKTRKIRDLEVLNTLGNENENLPR